MTEKLKLNQRLITFQRQSTSLKVFTGELPETFKEVALQILYSLFQKVGMGVKPKAITKQNRKTPSLSVFLEVINAE